MNTSSDEDQRPRSAHLLTVVDVMAMLSLSRSAIYQLIQRRELSALHIGRVLRFRPEQVYAYVLRRERALERLAAEREHAAHSKKPR